MATDQIFSLPNADSASRHLNVLKFNPTGDLLATGGSDGVLEVFSFSQNRYVLQKKFSSPITAMEWKSKWKFDGFFGIVGMFLGLHDGSILLLIFPVGDTVIRCLRSILV